MARMLDIAVRTALVSRWSALSVVTAGYASGAQAVQVTRHATDQMIGQERILIDSTDGSLSIETLRAGTKTLRHDFNLTVYVSVVVPGWTPDQAETRRGVLTEALLEDLLTATGVVLSGAVTGLSWCRPEGTVRTYSDLITLDGTTTTAYIAEMTLNVMGRV